MKLVLACLLVLAAAPAAQAAAPRVETMVVGRDGTVIRAGTVTVAETTVTASGKRCRVAAATPLAALAALRPGGLRIRDDGACSRRTADGGGLYVTQIARDKAFGRQGWVYKVGNRAGTAGAGDPAGPFGAGRLRTGQRLLWFWCRLGSTGLCQRTLDVRATGGVATVRAYDDNGRGRLAGNVRLLSREGALLGTTGADGSAALPAGADAVRAQMDGLVPSFLVDVRS